MCAHELLAVFTDAPGPQRNPLPPRKAAEEFPKNREMGYIGDCRPERRSLSFSCSHAATVTGRGKGIAYGSITIKNFTTPQLSAVQKPLTCTAAVAY